MPIPGIIRRRNKAGLNRVTKVCRFLALDVDGRGWPQAGRRDPVIAGAQARLPGLRPCGFHSPYEAAAWSVLAQRLRIVQAARLRAELIAGHGEDGAFPAPRALARAGLDLPGRKGEYLRAVAEAALDGLLDGAALRAVDPGQAVQRVQQVKGLGPFAAELVGPTAPGPPSTCVRCASSAPARSSAAEPPVRPDTLSDAEPRVPAARCSATTRRRGLPSSASTSRRSPIGTRRSSPSWRPARRSRRTT
jgi:hypothetical protein